jgi:hypothetical protein
MELSIRELNELIYCIGIARMNGQLLGTTVADKLENKLRIELDKRLEPDYITSESLLNKLKDAAGRYSDEVRVKHIHIEEDAFKKVLSSVEEPTNERFNGVSQFILDFVEANGAVSFTEMNDMYKAYTKGSNSFSHILKALRIPYKNRPTRRYLKKMLNGAYTIGIANPSNWVVVND